MGTILPIVCHGNNGVKKRRSKRNKGCAEGEHFVSRILMGLLLFNRWSLSLHLLSGLDLGLALGSVELRADWKTTATPLWNSHPIRVLRSIALIRYDSRWVVNCKPHPKDEHWLGQLWLGEEFLGNYSC